MALRMFRDKVVPCLGDLVRVRTVAGMTGIVVKVKDKDNDVSSEYFKGSPRKIFIIKWITGADWARAKIKTEFFEHQLEVISKAQNEKH
jgi:hypothetical protein|tara:strand:+ start:280 stop:546 length:267 start_codon:yes stop_codon:yes gene_type:complete